MPTAAFRDLDSRRQYWQRNAGLWALSGLLCLFSLIVLIEVGYRRGADQVYLRGREEAQAELTLQSQILQSHLEKYRLLPVLIARLGDHQKGALNDQPQALKTWLQQLGYLTGSYDVLLLSETGELLSAARHKSDFFPDMSTSDLVVAANEARLGRAYLPINNETQLYAFSSRLVLDDQADLIFVFLVDLAPILESWSLSGTSIIAEDPDGKVVLASEPAWIGETRLSDKFRNNPQFAPAAVELGALEWTIEAFIAIDNSALIRQTALTSTVIVLTIFIFFALYIRRRELQVKAILRDRIYAQELERQINFRTAELQSANEHLTEEVHERRRAEVQLKTTQQELIHSAKLATIGQMSTTLSHEYNQPLAAMRTYAENATRFLEMGKTEPVIDNLHRITQQVDRLGDLSRTLLGFARKPEDKSSAVNLHACVNEAILLARPRRANLNISIENLVDEHLLIKGRPVQISQVILNLLTNAIDAIAEQTETTKTQRIRLATKSTKKRCHLTIEDSGPGIAPGFDQNLFEPFTTSKNSGKGLGLGLSIVKDIIHAHNGTIGVKPGQLGGACFEVELPIWHADEQQ